MIRNFILTRTGDSDTADDCTHETFVRALRRRESFTCRGDGVRPWLFTIARNLVRDHRKAARFRVEVPVHSHPEPLDMESDPARAVIYWEGRRELARLLNALTPDQATCLRLRFIDRLSVHETARSMQRADTAVRALQVRALRKLAETWINNADTRPLDGAVNSYPGSFPVGSRPQPASEPPS